LSLLRLGVQLGHKLRYNLAHSTALAGTSAFEFTANSSGRYAEFSRYLSAVAVAELIRGGSIVPFLFGDGFSVSLRHSAIVAQKGNIRYETLVGCEAGPEKDCSEKWLKTAQNNAAM
jgi:hypothetical protein